MPLRLLPERRRAMAITFVLVAVAAAVRLAYLALYTSAPELAFSDPDGYLTSAALLVSPEGGWRWTFEAVYYVWGGRLYTLPPLYPVFLSIFALFPGYPLSAAIAQLILNGVTVALVVLLGTRLHNFRSGLIAGLLCALWGPLIVGARLFMQEALYVPLIAIAFLALDTAFSRSQTSWRFFVAGAALGLAALCRSMPLYFAVIVVVFHVAMAADRAGAARQGIALVAGFAALTVPYSVALSLHLGRPTFIEDHGGILVALDPRLTNFATPPSTVEVTMALISQMAAHPVAFASAVLDNAKALFHVSGGRFLQQSVNAATSGVAAAWKVGAHIAIDGALLVSVLLGPFGAALARNKVLACLSVGWILLNVGLAATAGFGGARLRAPFEVHLMVLAGVVLSGMYVRTSRPALSAAIVTSVVLACAMFPQVPRALEARANYGVEWRPQAPPHVGTMKGDGGFNALLESGRLSLRLTNPGDVPLNARVSIGRERAGALVIEPRGSQELRLERPGLTLAFVEIHAWQPAGVPGLVVIEVPRR